MTQEKNNLAHLPIGWTRIMVGQAIKSISLTGKKLKQSEYQGSGVMPVIDQGIKFIGGYTDKRELEVCCVPPVIVFGDHTKIFKYVDFSFVVGADGVKVLEPIPVFYPKLLFYFLQATILPEKGYARHFQFLEKSFVPLPPLPEQHRIVAKIEELFTRLDAGIDALNKTKLQLKRYHQAALKAAFEGELTAEWREIHKGELEPASVLLEKIKEERAKSGKHKELPPLDTLNLPALPEGWEWARLEDFTEINQGQSPPSSTYNEEGKGLPFYQGKLEFGKIYPIPCKWCTAPHKIAEKGDVLISVRAPVGPTNLCPERSCIGRGLAAIRGLCGVEAFFILYLMRASEQILSGQGVGTTFNAITGNQLRNLMVPLPSLREQHIIIDEIERHFSIIDNIEKTVEQSLNQSSRLRQSILKQAFEGKLVPQGPNDEPAEKLLERIKVEKARQQASIITPRTRNRRNPS